METRLDKRYSSDGAVATPWEEARERVRAAGVSWLTTLRADGRPHITPLLTVWVADAVYFCTGAEEQKALNLAANPRWRF
ncbi:pyridoxamine 5'-phosphate oxidase family protein [Amycolatopsis acidicola]|uniref:Pyridoxamine 5'-phosphate oxidase family protein n=1 Tax=Amycolatopsis acidicola TaxID=2596893 RepID=A0A5N0UTQ7_9PSEU|nr:pyridoxamine 5'-phosphate oxidase family protein [Amycolatopsis acidicola]KAA9153261.1 pyridoxamine 5'-phosphate oxidase family protein [Amycolatopsis acidicola]